MQNPNEEMDRHSPFFVVCAVALTALAAGMGWGIRGQYGHETGAMIAGALTSLTLILLMVPNAPSLVAARAAAMMTIAIGIGGSMTYGQTIGLTHDAPLIGNWEALRWGMLGLFIKGGIWIGFAGTFLGMGLGGKRYRPGELLGLSGVLLALMFLGIWLINAPFDPSNRTLPRIYFSDSWYFEPDAQLKPRPEVWGGLLVAWLGLVTYVGLVRGDRLAWRMALVGFVAGGLGFPGGQSVQAFHAWNPQLFTEGALSGLAKYFQYFNWWNMMETTFGLIFGGVLAIGLWLNRRWISVDQRDEVTISPPWEITLCATHLVLLLTAEFLRLPGRAAYLGRYTEFGLLMAILPWIGVSGGRFWPYLMLFPITAAPIVGKTLRQMSYENHEISLSVGWFSLVLIPMSIMIITATNLIWRGMRNQSARSFAAMGLFTTTWLYFGLNSVFFRFPWVWMVWTSRTPNQIIYSVCAISLSTVAIIYGIRLANRASKSSDVPLSSFNRTP